MWVPASPVVISLIVKAMLPPQRVPWLPEEFFVTAGNEGLSVVLLTLPACSAMGYSIGVLLAGGFRSRTGGGRAGLARQLLLLALISLALLVPLTSVVHKFEQTRVLGWSKVRSIIEPLGLPISTDPNLLCAAPTGARLHLLRPAMVESLGNGVCSGGRLIETKGPQTSSAFSIERVKVLDGPEAGRGAGFSRTGFSETLSTRMGLKGGVKFRKCSSRISWRRGQTCGRGSRWRGGNRTCSRRRDRLGMWSCCR